MSSRPVEDQLTDVDLGRSGATPDADGPGEFVCPECGRRCTRGPSGTEYGHRKRGGLQGERCPRRSTAVDANPSGGDSA